MIFQRFYLDCLAQASFLIGDDGQAVVVDPRRDVDIYIDEAKKLGLTIRYVIETHLHADFVSGHLELAKRTGAEIILGAKASPQFDWKPAKHGDVLTLGKMQFTFMETPGHTPESITIKVEDLADSSAPIKLLTGDTLFIGDVGRPDLVASKGFTSEQMAGMLYDSLHNSILPLADETEIHPAHGAGSACGKAISSAPFSTLGEQKQSNYALQPMDRDDFIHQVIDGLPSPPAYFPRDAAYNMAGPACLEDLVAPPALSTDKVQAQIEAGAYVLDVREREVWTAGHIPGSVNLGLGGKFASWAGTLLPFDGPLVLVTEDEAQVGETRIRLARVGLENVVGYLEGGVAAWTRDGRPLTQYQVVTPKDLEGNLNLNQTPLQVLDVRKPGEFGLGHLPGAIRAELAPQMDTGNDLEQNKKTLVACQGGYRAAAAMGLLARQGWQDLVLLEGGIASWADAGYQIDRAEPVSAK